jgi:hypothetical protein
MWLLTHWARTLVSFLAPFVAEAKPRLWEDSISPDKGTECIGAKPRGVFFVE